MIDCTGDLIIDCTGGLMMDCTGDLMIDCIPRLAIAILAFWIGAICDLPHTTPIQVSAASGLATAVPGTRVSAIEGAVLVSSRPD